MKIPPLGNSLRTQEQVPCTVCPRHRQDVVRAVKAGVIIAIDSPPSIFSADAGKTVPSLIGFI